MDKTSLGILLMVMGAIELVLLSVLAAVKHKPALLLAGIGSGTATGLIGLLIYLGKILT
jgi:hypothetical protein